MLTKCRMNLASFPRYVHKTFPNTFSSFQSGISSHRVLVQNGSDLLVHSIYFAIFAEFYLCLFFTLYSLHFVLACMCFPYCNVCITNRMSIILKPIKPNYNPIKLQNICKHSQRSRSFVSQIKTTTTDDRV